METVSRVIAPFILVGIMLCLTIAWNLYMNHYSKHKLLNMSSENIAMKFLFEQSSNISDDNVELVDADGDGNSEVKFSQALSKIEVGEHVEIKVDE